MSETITLLGVPSPNVLKVAIMLEELGLEYATRPVALFKGEQFSPEFRALNPVGKVPVLLDPALGRPIAESGAILIWLAESRGAFLPREGVDRYEVIQWLMVQMAGIGPMLGQYTHFSLLPPDTEPYARGRYRGMAERWYGLLNERVAQREWIAGEAYSVADIATLPWAEYLINHGYGWSDFPALSVWRDRIASRPAVIRAKQRLQDDFLTAAVPSMKRATETDLDRFFGRTETMPATDYSAVIPQ